MLAIAVILTTLGTVAFTRIIAENRMATAVNDFVSTLQMARSEAIKRGVAVSVCVPTDDDNAPCGNDVGGWDATYVVIADEGGAREELLRVQADTAMVQVNGEGAGSPTAETVPAIPSASDELHFLV
jgi:type IV fimbrial biogenesis protein FimT